MSVPASYNLMWRLARPAIPFILKRRAAANKEDPARIDERYGRLEQRSDIPRSPIWIHAVSVGESVGAVALARALLMKPKLVLADEPTGNLSSKAGEEVVGLLRDVCTQLSATILLVTHNPRDAAAGDRVLFLHDGALLPQAELTSGPFDVADVFHRLQELGV